MCRTGYNGALQRPTRDASTTSCRLYLIIFRRNLPTFSYIALAVRLGLDDEYRRWAGHLITERSYVLWERQEVVHEWAQFLATAAGRRLSDADKVRDLLEYGGCGRRKDRR